MLVGVVAFNVLRVIEPSEPRALGVLLTGYIFQGMWRMHIDITMLMLITLSTKDSGSS